MWELNPRGVKPKHEINKAKKASEPRGGVEFRDNCNDLGVIVAGLQDTEKVKRNLFYQLEWWTVVVGAGSGCGLAGVVEKLTAELAGVWGRSSSTPWKLWPTSKNTQAKTQHQAHTASTNGTIILFRFLMKLSLQLL